VESAIENTDGWEDLEEADDIRDIQTECTESSWPKGSYERFIGM